MADKNDAYYMKKALVEIEIIISYTKGLSYEEAKWLIQHRLGLFGGLFLCLESATIIGDSFSLSLLKEYAALNLLKFVYFNEEQ